MSQYKAILVGRSNSGKTTLIQSLCEPTIQKSARGFTEAQFPERYFVDIINSTIELLSMTFADTVGLVDIRSNMNESKSDAAIVNELNQFLHNYVPNIDCVCFVSRAGKTHQTGIEVF